MAAIKFQRKENCQFFLQVTPVIYLTHKHSPFLRLWQMDRFCCILPLKYSHAVHFGVKIYHPVTKR